MYDFAWFFRDLERNSLADMNDPSRFDGRRIVAVDDSERATARESVRITAEVTKLTLECHKNGNEALAVEAMKILFT
ncbi:hypothetical protein [Microbacterium suaedae]|uniref:hypothetical protein n=1 Tax=Microbacterium suaedae TaxID=2067813 RepID=UPI000DA1E86A|nr:hypothetical protein [Microbacterium suaedae]